MQALKFGFVVAFASCTTFAHAEDQAATDPDLGNRIIQAAAYDGKLWLMGAPGSEHATLSSLISIDLSTNARNVEDKNGTAALYRASKGLWTLQHRKGDPSNRYIVSQRGNGAWSKLADVTLTAGEIPVALTEVRGGPAIITSMAIRMRPAGEERWTSVSLENLEPWGMTVGAASGDGIQIYLGFDRGEWGGGLLRIDAKKGGGMKVEKRGAGLCEGDLNSDCDPVTGVIPDRTHPDCVIVSWGLSHFETSGRILRVCGTDVRLLYKDETIKHFPGGDFPVSVPFFSLAAASDGFWTVSYDSLMRFRDDKLVQKYSLPELRLNNGIRMSRDIPGVIVIQTDANAAMSLSGETPLIVPVED